MLPVSAPVGGGTAVMLVLIVVSTLYAWRSDSALEKACLGGLGFHHRNLYPYVFSTFVHWNMWHLLLNCLALADIGYAIERMLGMARFLLLYLFDTIITSALVGMYYTLKPGTCVLGASGVIFALLTFWCYNMQGGKVTFFWLDVNSLYIPWLTLVLVQLLFWNVSFVGHLCGILTGLLSYYLYHSCVAHGRYGDVEDTPFAADAHAGTTETTSIPIAAPFTGKGNRLGSS